MHKDYNNKVFLFFQNKNYSPKYIQLLVPYTESMFYVYYGETEIKETK